MKPRPLRWLGAALAVCCLGAGLLVFSRYWKSGPAIAGSVRLDGNPLPWGSIRFVPVEGTPGPDAGAVIDEGAYEVTRGLTAGKYQVKINGCKEHTLRKEQDPIIPVEFIPEEQEAVPAEYSKKSQLFITVQARFNPRFDFELTSSRKRK
jgi:hypothetical protein